MYPDTNEDKDIYWEALSGCMEMALSGCMQLELGSGAGADV
jgi:hypothetical protein